MSDNASRTNPFKGQRINVIADTPAAEPRTAHVCPTCKHWHDPDAPLVAPEAAQPTAPSVAPDPHGPDDGCAALIWAHMEAEPGFNERLQQAEADIAAGKGIPFREVRGEPPALAGLDVHDERYADKPCLHCGSADHIQRYAFAAQEPQPFDPATFPHVDEPLP